MENKVIKTIKSRYSTKAYGPKKLELSKLNAILEAGKTAPNGMNRQTANILALRSKKYVEKLRELSLKVTNRDCYYGASTMVLVYSDENDRFVDVDCACILENMFIAATSLNVGCCWINQTNDILNSDEGKKFRHKLGLDGKKVVGTCVLGYCKEGVEFKVKPRKEDFIKII